MTSLNSHTAAAAQTAHLALLSACAQLTLSDETLLLERLRTLTPADLAPLLNRAEALDVGHGAYRADALGLRWLYEGRSFPLWSCDRGGLSAVVPIATWTEGWARTALTLLGERTVAPSPSAAPMLKIGDTVAVKIADIKSVGYALSWGGDARFYNVQITLDPDTRPVVPAILVPWTVPTTTPNFTPPETVPTIHRLMIKALTENRDAVIPVLTVTDAGGTKRYCFDYAQL